MPELYFILELVPSLPKKTHKGRGSEEDGRSREARRGLIIKKEQIGASGAPGSILIDSERGVSTF